MKIHGELKRQAGIYCIRNDINGKAYYGSSVDLKRRYNSHIKGLHNGYGQNLKLQRAVDKYGITNFTFIILEKWNRDEIDKKELLKKEQTYLDKHQPHINGYNIAPIAGSNLGYKKTNEQRQRTVEAWKKLKESCEWKKQRNERSKRMIGEKNPQFGKTTSDKQKAAVAKASAKRERTQEERDKISKSNTGKKRTDEQKANIIKGRDVEKFHRGIKRAAEKRKIQVNQYDTNMNLIKEWPSSKEIEQELGYLRGNIAFACRNNCKRYGYYWKYVK